MCLVWDQTAAAIMRCTFHDLWGPITGRNLKPALKVHTGYLHRAPCTFCMTAVSYYNNFLVFKLSQTRFINTICLCSNRFWTMWCFQVVHLNPFNASSLLDANTCGLFFFPSFYWCLMVPNTWNRPFSTIISKESFLLILDRTPLTFWHTVLEL